MNRIYRLIWNHATNAWACCAETAKGRGKPGGVSGVRGSGFNPTSFNGAGINPDLRMTVLAASLALIGSPAYAAPAGGQISAGSGSIGQNGTTTTITQTSQNLAINWQSFGIAKNESVNFAQPGASAIALNRITGQNPSQILGSLSANGQVFILNPNGILFGKGAQVNVGGLVASTLSLSDADFMAGKHSFSGTGGSVVNQGTLTANPQSSVLSHQSSGGYIALLAPQARNEGVISATLGTVVLAAGNKITLNLNSGSLVGYTIDQGALNALADNKQLVRADGGQVYMSAKAADALSTAVVNNTGVIQARTIQNRNGVIKLIGDMEVGTVNVGGTLDASAPADSAGAAPAPVGRDLSRQDSVGINPDLRAAHGGFIETSAAHVKIADNAKITTAAANGLNGTWLIDPVDLTIAATGGDMTGATLTANLAAGNVTILSTAGTVNAVNGLGDVNVNDAVSWGGVANNKLTLNAQRNININAAMTASGTASLALQYGQGAVALANTSNIITGAAGVVNLPGFTTNFTTLQGSDGAVKNYTVITALGAAGSVTTSELQGMNGNVALNYALGANINATATSTWNAGAGFAPVGPSFSGTFDGLGHIINGLTINRTTGNLGLFGNTTAASVIRNVGLVNVNVADTTGSYVGGLVGRGYGTISNSYVTGSVSGTSYVGGLVGDNKGGTIDNSYVTGSVSGTGNQVGGLLGRNNAGTISNSYATGSVTGTGNDVGGLVGNGQGGTISNSYATGSVSGANYVGGLLGVNGGTISNSYHTTGSVSSTGTRVGGLVWSGGTITNSYYDMDGVAVNTLKPVAANGLYTAQFSDWKNGGFALNPVTYFGAATAANTYSISTVQNLKDLLGFTGNAALTFNLAGNIDMTAAPAGFYISTWAGTFDGTGKTISNFTLDNPKGHSNIGLFGTALAGSTIKNVGLLNVNVTGTTGNRVGGLVGSNRATISNSYVTGSVSSTSGSNIGGLVGYNYNGGTISTISNSYVTGSVSSTSGSNIGGLVGASYGTISNSYATGNVSSTSGGNIGGLLGASSYTISNSYATGFVTGASNIGGLVGYNRSGGTVTSSFWDVTKSGKADGLGIGQNVATAGVAGTPQTGLTGLTTAQMHAQASFIPVGTAAGQWNFTPATGTWVMFEGQSNPLLRALMTPLTVTANNASKTYDGLAYNGNAGVTYSVTPNTNLLGTLSYTGTSQGASNAGSYTITASGLTSAPVQQGYIISYANGTLTVNPANLAVTGVTASNKVYDATTAATLTGTATVTALGSDAVTLGGVGGGAFADKNVGTAKAVTVGGYTLGGAAAGNYTLVQPTGLTANITPANLAVTGLTASNKTYDTTTAASLTGTAIVAALGSDVVTLGGTGSGVFADKNVGTAKTVTVGGYTLGGAAAGNYTLVQPAGLTANITQANLAVTGVTASNKVYDATTAATLTGTATVTALGSDVVILGGTGAGAFADANAGTAKAVSVGGYTLGGAGAGNYTLVQPAGLTANITAVVVAATPAPAATTVATTAAPAPAAKRRAVAPQSDISPAVAQAIADRFASSPDRLTEIINLLNTFSTAKAAAVAPPVVVSNSFGAPLMLFAPPAAPQASGQPAAKPSAPREEAASDNGSSSPATSTQARAAKPAVIAQTEPATVQQIGMVTVIDGGIRMPENIMTSLRGGATPSGDKDKR